MSPLPVGEPVEPGDPELRPRRAPLEGRAVRLEPIDPARHAGALFACSHGTAETEELWTYMPYGPFADLDAMRVWLDAIAPSEDPLFFAVVDLERESPVGMASFLNVDATMRRVELGHIWYGAAAQRTRANTEAAALMLAHAFDVLRYRRVEWKCDALNERSRAAALRLGFTFEGIFRQHMVVKGRNRDTAWFSMLDVEWPSVRDAIDRWLDADPGSVSLADMRAGIVNAAGPPTVA